MCIFFISNYVVNTVDLILMDRAFQLPRLSFGKSILSERETILLDMFIVDETRLGAHASMIYFRNEQMAAREPLFYGLRHIFKYE